MRVLRNGIWTDLKEDNARLKAKAEKKAAEIEMIQEMHDNESDPKMRAIYRDLARSMDGNLN